MTIKTCLDPALHEAARKVASSLGITLAEYLRGLVVEDLASRNGDVPRVMPPSGGDVGDGGKPV
jgi:hypothetical protein